MSLILKGFGELAQELIEAGREGTQAIGVRLYSALNALYESAAAKPAPGSTRRDIRPHDHTPFGGGRPVARGAILSFDIGEDTGLETTWSRDIPVPDMGTWLPILTNGRSPHLKAPVSWGVDDGNTAMGGGSCRLEGRFLFDVELGSATSVDVRIVNTTNGLTSSTYNISSSGVAWVPFSTIPPSEGAFNDFDIEVRGNGTGPCDRVSLYAGCVAEMYDTAQPTSAGSYRYDSVPRP